MPTVGESFRIYYEARDATPSLGDVTFAVIRPDGVIEGAFSMTEAFPGNPLFAGLYYADYTPPIVGHYFVRATSASTPMLDRKGFYAETTVAMTLTGEERDAIAAALLDLANSIEPGLTLRQAMRLTAAVLGGKISGAGTGTETFRSAVADAADRVIGTVDIAGNRTDVETNLS